MPQTNESVRITPPYLQFPGDQLNGSPSCGIEQDKPNETDGCEGSQDAGHIPARRRRSMYYVRDLTADRRHILRRFLAHPAWDRDYGNRENFPAPQQDIPPSSVPSKLD